MILTILMVGSLMVALVLLLVRGFSQPGSVSETAQARPPVNQEEASGGLPTADAAEKKETPASVALVDPRGPVASMAPESPLSIPEHWGIEITKVGVAAGGKALDLRYKVVDVAKATSLLYLTNYVYIFNHSNQKALMVPFQRENQTSQKLIAGKTYFTLLPNKEERVTPVSTVTVVVGGSRAENLMVN